MPYPYNEMDQLDPQQAAVLQQLYPNVGSGGSIYGNDDVPDPLIDGNGDEPIPESQSPPSPQSPLSQGALPPRGPLPTGPPPPPAARLQIPTTNRANLYQQLRPYPGMSRAEKLSRLLADSFRTAAAPGTGNAMRDAAYGFSSGLDSYNHLRDVESANRKDYAGAILSQVGSQEEAARKAADTGADIEKKYGEADRAHGLADYARNRGSYYPVRGANETRDSLTRERVANNVANRLITVSPGAQLADPTTHKVVVDNTRPPVEPDKVRIAKFVNGELKRLYGDQHTVDAEAAVTRRITGADPTPIPKNSAAALIIDAMNETDPVLKAQKEEKLKEFKRLNDTVNPPKVKTGKKGKTDPWGDIIEFNMHKFASPDGKTVNWEGMKQAARKGELERNNDLDEQRNVRNSELVERIEKKHRASEAKGTGNSGPYNPPGGKSDKRTSLIERQLGEFAASNPIPAITKDTKITGRGGSIR